MSQKINANAIRQQTRQEVAKQYRERIESLHKNWQKSDEKCNELWLRNRELKNENDELKEKLHEYEDWIERLQEFVNMNSDERDKAIRKYREEKEIDEIMKTLLNSPFMRYASEIF